MSKRAKRSIFLCSSIAFLAGLFFQYVSVYYRMDVKVLDTYKSLEVDKVVYDDMITYGDKKSKIGIIFYPGARVEYTSYEPLMRSLADQGFFCVLIEMPYNLAVFGIDSADGIQDKFTGIAKWYMMGHSLGGAMAGTYLVDNYKDYEGLILLGAYVADSLRHTDLEVISIFGSEDTVIDKARFNKYKDKLPEDYQDMIIQGGNHAYFGVYGEQAGDGEAQITNEQQIKQTVDIIKLLVK